MLIVRPTRGADASESIMVVGCQPTEEAADPELIGWHTRYPHAGTRAWAEFCGGDFVATSVCGRILRVAFTKVSEY